MAHDLDKELSPSQVMKINKDLEEEAAKHKQIDLKMLWKKKLRFKPEELIEAHEKPERDNQSD